MLRYFFSVLVAIAWALWLGGLMTLFLVVTQLSETFAARRDLFGTSASGVFLMFERYQLIVGAVALVSAFALRLLTAGGARTALFCLLAVAAVGAVVSPKVITPRIEAMRVSGETNTPQFKKLHGRSMMVYSGDALVLLIAGTLLPAAVSRKAE